MGKALRVGVTQASLVIAAAVLAACASAATPAAPPSAPAFVTTPSPATPPPTVAAIAVPPAPPPPPPPPPTPTGFTLRTQTGQPPGGFLVVVSGLNPDEPFVLVVGVPGQAETTQLARVADGRGGFTLGFSQVGPGGSCLLAQRSSGEIARSEIGVAAGSTCAALAVAIPAASPAASPAVSPAAPPTPAGFALRVQIGQPPGGFTMELSGLNPNESVLFQDRYPGELGPPTILSLAADGNGGYTLHFTAIGTGGDCLLVKRSSGEIAKAQVGVASGTCPADLAAATPTVGPGVAAPGDFPPGAGPGVTPQSGPLGTTFIVCFTGLPANASPVQLTTYLGGQNLGSGAHEGTKTSASGSYCLQIHTGAQNGLPQTGTYTETAMVAGVSRSLDFTVR